MGKCIYHGNVVWNRRTEITQRNVSSEIEKDVLRFKIPIHNVETVDTSNQKRNGIRSAETGLYRLNCYQLTVLTRITIPQHRSDSEQRRICPLAEGGKTVLRRLL